MRRTCPALIGAALILALLAPMAAAHLEDKSSPPSKFAPAKNRATAVAPMKDRASFAGILNFEWAFDIVLDGTDHAFIGSSPALADIAVNNSPSPGEQDADLEVFTGNDSYVMDFSCMGRWYLLDSRGAQEWSTCTQSDEPGSSPVIADLNADCILEMGSGTTSGRDMEILDKFGTMLWYWPPPLIDGQDYCDYWYSSPAAADIDPANPGYEITAGRNDGYVRVFSGSTGAVLWETKVAPGTECFFPMASNYIYSSPAVGNIDASADGSLEIVIGTNNNEVVELDRAGNILWRFSTGGMVRSSAALANLDSDPAVEIVIGCEDSKLYLIQGDLNSNNVIDPGEFTSFTVGGAVNSSPAIGDLDGDGVLDIVVGSEDSSLYAFNYDTATDSLVKKWSFAANGVVRSSPALADRSGSKLLDVYVGSDDNNVYLLAGATGLLIDSFDTGGPVESSPAVADIDGDGLLEIVVMSWEGNGHAYERIVTLEDTGTKVPPHQIEWGKFRRDHLNDGRYGGVAYPYYDASCLTASLLCCDAGAYPPAECTGASTTVTLDGTGSVGAASWTWEGPFDESPASGETVTATFHGNGQFQVKLTVSNGTDSSECETVITIQDTTPPDITCPAPATLTLDGSCQAIFTTGAAASDVCSSLTVSSVPALPATFGNPGVRDIVFEAEDALGNVASCSTKVTLVDGTPPDLACPTDTLLEVGSNCTARFGDMATGTDNCCMGPVSPAPTLPGFFGPGDTTVSYTGWDASGNSDACSTKVTAVDRIPPIISCPAPVTLLVDAACQAPYNELAAATDNCTSTAITSTPPVPAVFSGIGQRQIIFVAADGAGNSVTCTADALLKDAIPPTVGCPPPMVLPADAQCLADTPIQPAATDNCMPPKTEVCPTGPYRLGKTDILVTASDESCNAAQCSTSVTVIDVTPPEVQCDLVEVPVDDEDADDEDADEGSADEGSDGSKDKSTGGILYRVEITSLDNCSDPCCTATLNGIPVADGQQVRLRLTDHELVYFETSASGGPPILVLEGPYFVLEVTCADQAGNRAVCRDEIEQPSDETLDSGIKSFLGIGRIRAIR